jgi:hypothetical protein
MCVCVYVCMCVCMHVCMYACMHVCMYACMHVCMCACVHVCMYACVHVCMYGCMYVCRYVGMYVRTYVCGAHISVYMKKSCLYGGYEVLELSIMANPLGMNGEWINHREGVSSNIFHYHPIRHPLVVSNIYPTFI